ncbi:hypothetical protein GWK36_10205 [Caldichromatium japonicum]|uniref:Crp/Fnr family transcriptional regulator n=1 Tax=Caldichromatium japonicum TaxID=2699430 RepID=A0A6G7VE19_9GAMM|nr:hypothetical protein [Caldichromatium japonicum]QIK38289.1 hypothetical protein GWK36_10205 [Caldichromatium japonicum]
MAAPPLTSASRQRLLACWHRLAHAERETLLAFAEFLVNRAGVSPSDGAGAIPTPQSIPRPPTETVIGAIRRLSQSYAMLDRDALLHEASALMSAHVLQGRPASEVIEELEALFARHYQHYRAKLIGQD